MYNRTMVIFFPINRSGLQKIPPSQARTGSGEIHRKVESGIKVTFRLQGHYAYFDSAQLLNVFTAAIVLVGLPSMIICFLIMWCLGLLSKIYQGATRQTFNLRQEIQGFATRMLMAKKTYELLCSRGEGGGGGRGGGDEGGGGAHDFFGVKEDGTRPEVDPLTAEQSARARSVLDRFSTPASSSPPAADAYPPTTDAYPLAALQEELSPSERRSSKNSLLGEEEREERASSSSPRAGSGRGLRCSTIELQMRDVFQSRIAKTRGNGEPDPALSGVDWLDEEEWDRFAGVLMAGLDRNRNGVVSQEEFVESALANEPLEPEDLVKLFDRDR